MSRLAIGCILAGLLSSLSIVPACAADLGPGVARTADEQQCVQLIQAFFRGYDRHDPAAATVALTSDARIIRPDATQSDVQVLIRDIKQAQLDPAAMRKLDNFEFAGSGLVRVIAFDDTVRTSTSADVPVIHKFRESWYLERTRNGWRAFWVNFVAYGLDERAPFKTTPASPSGDRPRLTDPQQERAAEFVEGFFDAYQRHDGPVLRAMFLPHAKIVHMIALEQSVDEFSHDLIGHPEPRYKYSRPKPAPFDHLGFRKAGDFILISFDNHVSHWRDGHPDVEHTFRENWLLKETPMGMKVVWASYSIYGAAVPNLAKQH
jgi:hypothetical protein